MAMEDHYADTAYRGEPSPMPAPSDPAREELRNGANARRDRLARLGPQCGEYPFELKRGDELVAQPNSRGGRIYQEVRGDELWPSGLNPLLLLTRIAMTALIWFLLGVLTWATTGGDFLSWSFFFVSGLPGLFALLLFAIIYFFPTLGHRGNTRFCRRDGRVYPSKHPDDDPIYFKDLDAYVVHTFRGTGATGQKLVL